MGKLLHFQWQLSQLQCHQQQSMQNCKGYVQLLSCLISLTMEYQMKVEYTTMRGNIQCKCILIYSYFIED